MLKQVQARAPPGDSRGRQAGRPAAALSSRQEAPELNKSTAAVARVTYQPQSARQCLPIDTSLTWNGSPTPTPPASPSENVSKDRPCGSSSPQFVHTKYIP